MRSTASSSLPATVWMVRRPSRRWGAPLTREIALPGAAPRGQDEQQSYCSEQSGPIVVRRRADSADIATYGNCKSVTTLQCDENVAQ